jgi:peptide deformylase
VDKPDETHLKPNEGEYEKMAVREILNYPKNKAALRKKSKPVRSVDRFVARLVKDLKETLIAHPEGIGLAAPQINVHQRVVVVRLGARSDEMAHPDPPIALVNPKIIKAQDERKDFDGCLSFPGLYGETIRPHYLRVTGWDERGKSFDRVFKEFDAVLVHHEIDHLDGVLFIDRVESIEDLYRVREVEDGKLVRVPVSVKL